MYRLVAFGLFLIAFAMPAVAQITLRFASWNIANFTDIENVEHRPGIGTKRHTADFATLKQYAAGLNADVIALQEIGTIAAAEMLFPSPNFTVYPAEQLVTVTTAGPSEDIYTAVAIRNRPDLVVVRQEDLNDLAVIDLGDGHRVRSGTALLLKADGNRFWVMSVHLKSSCADIMKLITSTNTNCMTLWSQRIPLRAWIADREASGDAFAIMGDFNRQFRRFGADDQFWKALSVNGASQPAIVAHPATAIRDCPTRLGNATLPIDWIMLSTGLAPRFVEDSYWETRYSMIDVNAHGGRLHTRLSDHCPIQVDLAF